MSSSYLNLSLSLIKYFLTMRTFSNLIAVIAAVQCPRFDATQLEKDIAAAATAATAAAAAAATADGKAVAASTAAANAKEVSLQAVDLVSTALSENTQLDSITLALHQTSATLLGKAIGDIAILDDAVTANKSAIDAELVALADDLVVTFSKIDTNFREVGVAV
jgi:3-oxoacyl-ACP reductase-like protein